MMQGFRIETITVQVDAEDTTFDPVVVDGYMILKREVLPGDTVDKETISAVVKFMRSHSLDNSYRWIEVSVQELIDDGTIGKLSPLAIERLSNILEMCEWEEWEEEYPELFR